MRATDARSADLDLDPGFEVEFDLPDIGRGPADLAPRATRPRVTPPVVPPARHQRGGRQSQPRSAPRPRPMRKPGGVR